MRLARAARDRALQLTPQLAHWPDCVGVACTATVVSHYTRRGQYRAHAATADGLGAAWVYSHTLIKGARDRPAEDAACANLGALVAARHARR